MAGKDVIEKATFEERHELQRKLIIRICKRIFQAEETAREKTLRQKQVW